MKGKFKVRFANDMTRVKVLAKGGHEAIDLVEFSKAMSKKDVVKSLLGMSQFTGEARAAIEAANVKYNGEKTVKVKSTAKKPVKATSKKPAAPVAAPVKTESTVA